MKGWRKALTVFRETVAIVIGCAPDDFPLRDYLPPERQLNLDRAYEKMLAEFRAFVDVYGESPVTVKWQADIEESYQLYKKGDKLAGMQHLNELYNDLWEVSGGKGDAVN